MTTVVDTPVLSVRDLEIDFWVDGVWYPAVVGSSAISSSGSQEMDCAIIARCR